MLASSPTRQNARVLRHAAYVLLAGALLTLGACGSGSNTQPNDPPPPPPNPNPIDTSAPSVPQNLTASAASATRIELTWAASTDTGGSGLAGYRIYRDGATTALATVTATTYADASVAANTAYSYTVRSFDGAGNTSAASSAATATTPAAPPVSSSGLDARPANTTCTAWEKDATQLQLSRVFPALRFSNPIAMLQAPGINTHWYLVEKSGVVRRFENVNNVASTAIFVDIRDRVDSNAHEAGLLGMAFHPNFPTDRRVFLSYTHSSGRLISRVSSFMASADGSTLDPASEVVLLTANQPAANHNGGHIAFGPDDYLYIGFGDGGGGGDPYQNGQRLTTLLGKLLRIDVDVDAATRYVVPESNPFFNAANPTDKCPDSGSRASGTCPEIYAYGLRNPWRWNFDRANGDLWLADVGQGNFEEVNRIASRGNYGWSCREGAHDYPGMSCIDTPIDPVAEYPHPRGESITGGYVYRGTQATPLVGRFIFGDFVSGRIWTWIDDGTSSREPTELTDSSLGISSFAQGNDGELYALDYIGGGIHRLIFQSSGTGTSVKARLSETGCVDPNNPTQPASGLVPYDINAPFWSDGLAKNRWIALPEGTAINANSTGRWTFPEGTVLMKEFRNNTRLVETRLFMRHPDGSWGGFSYEWNAAQTDATLVRGGATRTIDGQQWIFPSEAQCMQCHTAAAGHALGPETAQLNRALTYPQTGRTAHQLTTLSSIGMLTPAITDPATASVMPNPEDASAPLADRARAYLHTNCAQCHRPGGPTQSNMDLRYTTSLAETNTCNIAPQLGDLGLGSAARLIAVGNADNSIVVNRANRRDAHAMPPVGSLIPDAAGVALLRQWIGSLSTCN